MSIRQQSIVNGMEEAPGHGAPLDHLAPRYGWQEEGPEESKLSRTCFAHPGHLSHHTLNMKVDQVEDSDIRALGMVDSVAR